MNNIEAKFSNDGKGAVRVWITCDACNDLLSSTYQPITRAEEIAPIFLQQIANTQDTKWLHMRKKHKESEARG